MVLQFLFPFLLLLPPILAAPFPFNYTQFRRTAIVSSSEKCSEGISSICLEGDASVGTDSTIQLTRSIGGYSSGWAFYSEPLHIRDNVTGEQTNFTTRFALNISKITADATYHADGMAFFLLPYPFTKPNYNGGGDFGLLMDVNSSDFTYPGKNRFVAVEFDTWQNTWDPPAPHLGIDVNSVRSVANQSLNDSGDPIVLGEARVDYNGVSKELSVSLTYNNGLHAKLTHHVDLATILPASVTVGFSGTTGMEMELNQLVSWSLDSTLDRMIEARDGSRKSGTGSPAPAPFYPSPVQGGF